MTSHIKGSLADWLILGLLIVTSLTLFQFMRRWHNHELELLSVVNERLMRIERQISQHTGPAETTSKSP